MTDKPTISLDQTEWRVLLASNIARVTEYLGQTAAIDAAAMKALHDHLDRAKALVTAWHNSAPAPVQEQPAVDVVASTNGATEPKRRGWPAGKPRKKRNAPMQAVQ